MAALTEFPDLAKSVFLTDTLNDEGIYAIKFFIRGKPWIVTVDDTVMMWSDVPNFASVGDDNTLWAPILQKAFAKVKGSYADANGGFVTTGFRSLVGSPVFDYLSDDESDYSEVFDRMKAANDLDYLLGAGTFGSDTSVNSCGVVAGHAYSVISAFELTDSNGDA
jgi:calpain-15